MPEFLQSGNPQLARNIIENELSNVQSTPQEKEEPAQVDAGYDDECCNEIRQMMIQINEDGQYDIDKEMIWRNERGGWQTSTRFDSQRDKKRHGAYAVGKDAMTVREWLESVDCEELLRVIGNSEPEVGKTFNDVYNECVTAKMPQGGDFTMGEPIDLAWRMLKHG